MTKASDSIHASYGEAFAQLAGSLSGIERSARAAAFDAFLEFGLPDDSIERWHYTNLAALPARPVRLAAAVDTPYGSWRLAGCDEHVFVNGRRVAGADTVEDTLPLPDTHAGLAGLHRAFAQPGLQLVVARRATLAQPVHLLTVSNAQDTGEMTHLAHRVKLERGAQATLIVQNVGLPGAERLGTQSLAIELDEGARLTLVRVQDESRATTQWLHCAATVGRDARLSLVNVDLGGQLIRNDWRVRLDAPGAYAELAGLFASEQKVHLDNQYEIDHATTHGTSRQFFRGLGFGPSRSVLNGRVVMQRGAQKSDSEQSIASLMLAKGAEIDAKPELEIYADDVKAAHGVSCGQLDPAAVFYLRARGVSEATARALLTYSFANDVIEKIPHAGLRTRVAQRITAALGADLDLDALRVPPGAVEAEGEPA
ncbi:SufB/SufD family protein [Solimonas soli]|uniref:SufB/SufD family protein n=1 Tax=Solimonas soli TaxID=413479 RepID=UPI0004AF2555|nr:SufD family Fe-S cluster assembly protein [Solimonas soli]